MKAKISGFIPVGYAIAKSLKNGYDIKTFKADIIAALVVSLVALPLAMALSIAVGLPPQYGLYTAIIAGAVVPLLGGSVYQVSGPTAAFVVIVAPIVSEHGLRGLIITTIIAGIMLILMGVAKLGRYINYVPYPVTTGFTSGIAVVIGTIALNDLLGLGIEKLNGEYIHKLAVIVTSIPNLYWPESLIGIISLVIISTSGYIIPRIPPPVVSIAFGAFLAYILQHNGFDIATIGSRFTFAFPDGSTGRGIPPFPPVLHMPGSMAGSLFAWPDYAEIKTLAIPALVIATLGALESLLSATVADGLANTKHSPNSELIAVGIGNILSGFCSGIPATGAIARTATNIHSGAKTPFASSMHSIFILLYVVILAPYMSYIPMASLAALLMSVAYRMSHYRQFIRTIMIAPGSDVIVLITCFGFTVFVDMVAGVTVGVVLACFLLLKRIAGLTKFDVSHKLIGRHDKIKHLILPDDVMIYHITGVLFFGTVENAFDRSGFISDHIKTLIIDMENVPLIDMTGLVAMKTAIIDITGKNCRIILCGQPEITDKIMQKLPSGFRQAIIITGTLEEAVNILNIGSE